MYSQVSRHERERHGKTRQGPTKGLLGKPARMETRRGNPNSYLSRSTVVTPWNTSMSLRFVKPAWRQRSCPSGDVNSRGLASQGRNEEKISIHDKRVESHFDSSTYREYIEDAR
jgi:hypothetical protein